MRRALVLGTLIAVGALSLAVSGQAPAGPSAAALAAMKIEKVKDNLYILTGSGVSDTFSGGNAAVFITDGGVTLVDTKLPGFGQTMLDRIKTVTTKPVTRIINTHAHGDHTGNNGFFGANVEIIVQENAKSVMAKLPEWSGANAQYLPNKTYQDKLTVGAGKDQIDLYYFGPGHTSGDTFVVFPALRTMHVGDMFAWKALPYVDTGAGGSVVAQPASLGKARLDRQERRHHHQRTHPGVDLERSEGVRRLHEGLRRVRRARDESREDRGPGGGGVHGAVEVQGLRRQRRGRLRQREGKSADRLRRAEEEIGVLFPEVVHAPPRSPAVSCDGSRRIVQGSRAAGAAGGRKAARADPAGGDAGCLRARHEPR